MTSGSRIWGAILGATCWALLGDEPRRAYAATFNVDTTTDNASLTACTAAPNDCSLRGAIIAANASAGPHTINLQSLTYRLTIVGSLEELAATGDLDIRQTITIAGPVVANSIIEAGSRAELGIDRVFHVIAGAGNLTLRNVTVRHGNTGTPDGGGGILAGGPLVLEDVYVTSNTSGSGGGLRIEQSATIRRSTISENTTSGGGGAMQIANTGHTVTVENSTLSGNQVGTIGGGIIHSGGTATLNNVTIAGNTAGGNGGGVRVASGTITVRNSIVANNTAAAEANCSATGTLTSAGNNLSNTTECPFEIEGSDPQLGALTDNGGGVPTHALSPGSPAIDAGNVNTPGGASPACAATDQRGGPRDQDGNGDTLGRCDIGAFEVVTRLVVDRLDDVNPAAQACLVAANDCSLRGAISVSNAVNGTTIQVPAGTYTLAILGHGDDDNLTGDLDILKPAVIEGAGVATTIIQAGTTPATGVDRVFEPRAPDGMTTFRDLTIRHGSARGDIGESAGGMFVRSSTTLERVHIVDNRGWLSGGMELAADTFIFESTISGNVADATGGGGIYIAANGISVSIANTTISGNSLLAFGEGGGLTQSVGAGSTTVTTMNNVTIANNSAPTGGGIGEAQGTMQLRNSIVANNTSTISNPNCFQNVTSRGNNLVFGADNCGLTGVSDIQNQDPLLTALQDNGGPTPTHAPMPGSPVIDAGNFCINKDQRGILRPLDGTNDGTAQCDIGSIEMRVLHVDRPDDTSTIFIPPCTQANGSDCSLRAAIREANIQPGTGVFLPNNTYTLSLVGVNDDIGLTGDLDVTTPMMIAGTGASSTVVQAGTTSANGIDRVLHVVSGSLALREVTLRHGRTITDTGGGILANAPVSLQRVLLLSNQADFGGGLDVRAPTIVKDSALTGNIATGTAGGGGVGLGQSGVSALISNTTIAANTAIVGVGGGLAQATSANVALNGVTIAGNAAGNRGGGISGVTTALTLRNSIVANNTATVSNPNCFNLMASQGNNLVFGGDTCSFTQPTDIQNQNPVLGVLGSNGGSTPTMALGPGSAAIDRGNGARPGTGGNACEFADQRGVPRGIDGDGNGGNTCDIGAYEAPQCTTRPNVAVAASASLANTIQVTISSTSGGIIRLRGIPATSNNILVDVNGLLNQPSSFDVAPSGTPSFVQLALHRANNAGSGTLSFVVTDGCGDWPTLAGGGPNAWGGIGSSGSSTAAQAVVPLAVQGAKVPTAPGAACAGFPSHAAAQAYLRQNPLDPLLLDSNRNGIACEGADGAGFVNMPLDHVPVPRP